MQIQEYKQATALLKESQLPRIICLRGDNDFYKSRMFEKLREKVVGKQPEEFAYQRFDDKNIDLNEVVACCEILPFLCPQKCVAVIDYPLDKLTDSDLELLTKLAEDMPEFTVLIFYQLSQQPDLKKSKGQKFCRMIQKYGCDIVFDNKQQRAGVASFVQESAREFGCSISSADAKIFSEKAGGDYNIMYREMEKICIYKGEGIITREDIEHLFSVYLNSTVYELTNAMLRGNFDLAYSKLIQLKQQREEPISILAALSSSFIDLYRADVAKQRGVSADQLKEDFKYPKNLGFRVDNAYRDCSRYNRKFLSACIEMMSDADVRLKSTGEDGYALLESLMTQIFIQRERA